MKVLVTGGFGNIGVHTLRVLTEKGHQVFCFGRKNLFRSLIDKNDLLKKNIKVIWGDIQNLDAIKAAIKDQDVVVHLAAMIQPSLKEDANISHNVNLIATQKIIQVIEAQPKPPFLIFASSIVVYGPQTIGSEKILTVNDSYVTSDNYSSEKIECEKLIIQSKLNWTILRISFCPPLKMQFNPVMFDINLKSKIEFIHPYDVALAIANSINNPNANKKIFLIGGGLCCQMTYKQLLESLTDCLGIEMFPESVFTTQPYYAGWFDTTESQALLHYQNHTLSDFKSDFKQSLGWRKPFIKLLSPVIRAWLLHFYASKK